MRIGFGYDTHRLEPGRRMLLGGVEIPCDFGPTGHSDADVLLHAIADALLGAAALGDIGAHFPDTDPRWKDADSLDLLAAVYSVIAEAGYSVGNVDATVILEQPKLFSHVSDMRRCIAGALQVDIGRVSVKATRGEGMGPVGRGEGIAAYAVCLLEPGPGGSN